jgi:hypothetical protein
MALIIDISAFNITAQIKTAANGQPFSAWDMSGFENLRDAFLNWLYNLKTAGKTEKQRELGADFRRNPVLTFTIEELCLLWILVNDPAYLGLTEAWADDFYRKIYERAAFNIGVTDRKTTLSNELASYKSLSDKYPDGIVNKLPQGASTDEINSTPAKTGTSSFSISESIKAALQSPLVWLLFVFALYKIIKKRKSDG